MKKHRTIFGEVFFACKETGVGIDTRSCAIVVAGTKMHVKFQFSIFFLASLETCSTMAESKLETFWKDRVSITWRISRLAFMCLATVTAFLKARSASLEPSTATWICLYWYCLVIFATSSCLYFTKKKTKRVVLSDRGIILHMAVHKISICI